MIIGAQQIGVARLPGLPDPAANTRGEPTHPVTVEDLVYFGRCPGRYRQWTPDPDKRPWCWEDLLRAFALVPGAAAAQYVPRPRAYPATMNTCPVCGSVGIGQTCRKCGQRRRMQSADRPWAGGAEYCKNWTAAIEAAGKYAVPPDEFDAVLEATAKLAANGPIAALYGEGAVWQQFTATWRDEATRLEVPLATTVHMLPGEGSGMDMAIGCLYVTHNAGFGPWTAEVIRRQLHVAAAFALDIVNAALQSSRTEVLWCVIESNAPYLVARRQPLPDLLADGRATYQQLLAAYARCLHNKHWPVFEAADTHPTQGWTGVGREPWMAESAAHTSQYFGIQAGLALPAS